jgi:hypothetical protein
MRRRKSAHSGGPEEQEREKNWFQSVERIKCSIWDHQDLETECSDSQYNKT